MKSLYGTESSLIILLGDAIPSGGLKRNAFHSINDCSLGRQLWLEACFVIVLCMLVIHLVKVDFESWYCVYVYYIRLSYLGSWAETFAYL